MSGYLRRRAVPDELCRERWLSPKAAALRASSPACAHDVTEKVAVQKKKRTTLGGPRCWPTMRKEA